MVSTLANQSAKRAMDELASDPDKLAERFVEFEPEEQQLLLREMGKRIAELQEVERIWKRLDVPTADLQVHTRSNTPLYQLRNISRREDGKREEINSSWLWQEDSRAQIDGEILQ